MIRTTVRLEEKLYKEARKKAIDERRSFTDIVSIALESYIRLKKKDKRKRFDLKIYDLGKIKGDLRRNEIYEDV